MPRKISIFATGVLILLMSLVSLTSHAQTSKMYGEVAVMSNFVEKGLSQSNKGPAVDAGLGYWFGTQGRIGISADSVKYPNDGANVRLAGFGEYKFIFSPTSDLRVRNDLLQYYSEGLRNGTIITLDQNFSGYHVIISREDNFEGTKTQRNWFGMAKDWPYGTSYQINLTAGYSMVDAALYNSFFDTRLGFSYVTSSLTVSLINTWVSSPAQFDGIADTSFFLVLAAKF